jgi:hypothetical protein
MSHAVEMGGLGMRDGVSSFFLLLHLAVHLAAERVYHILFFSCLYSLGFSLFMCSKLPFHALEIMTLLDSS